MTQQELMEAIKPMMRATDTATVLLAIARLCNEEAEYERECGHDGLNARRWDQAAEMIDHVAGNIPAV